MYQEDTLEEEKSINRSIKQIYIFLGMVATILSMIRLYTMVSLNILNRTKEIGIRKVLGSTVTQIVGMLAKDFIKLVVISLIIAFPAGYFFMELWLQNFAYHIDIAWWIYGLAAVITLLIAFGTICLRSVKAALMNPVESLKSE